MPGLRLGYGLTSNKEIIEKIYNYKEPWTINSFADSLSNYIFEEKKYIQDSKDYYINERKYMLQELRNIKNIVVYDSDTNFLLIRLNTKRANEIKVELLIKGNILVRDASNFIGLDDSYIRIAIKSHEENKILIKYMKDLLGD
jgi:threonine-phosphate decarboxylase